MKVKIYTTDTCPKCNVLKLKMDGKGIDYEEVTSVKEIRKLGVASVPWIVVDDEPKMDFSTANKWIDSIGAKNEY